MRVLGLGQRGKRTKEDFAEVKPKVSWQHTSLRILQILNMAHCLLSQVDGESPESPAGRFTETGIET